MKMQGPNCKNPDHRRRNQWVARFTARLIRKGVSLIVACGIALSVLPRIGAQSEGTSEYPVKLAFLYHFAQFVQWPPESFQTSTAPLVVCIVGGDPFDPDLEQELLNHTVERHPLAIMTVKRGADLRFCHMVFVPAPEWKQEARVIDNVRGASVLTVGETKGFAERGGIINFTIDRNKLRFAINLDAAKQTPLTISSKVLALAKIVRDPPHP